MINLLPPQEKQALHGRRVKKLTIILGCVCLVWLLCLWLVLLALKFHILGESAKAKTDLREAQQKYQTEDFLAYQKRMKEANTQFAVLKSFSSQDKSMAEVLEFISGLQKPAGVKLTDISLKIQEGRQVASISGLSTTRENLLAFKTLLEENSQVKKMDFPPNNWLRPANLDFYLTFEYAKPQ